jgi:hypothetical protein
LKNMSTNHNKSVINRKHEHFDDEENILLKSDIFLFKIRSVPFWNKIFVCMLAMLLYFCNWLGSWCSNKVFSAYSLVDIFFHLSIFFFCPSIYGLLVSSNSSYYQWVDVNDGHFIMENYHHIMKKYHHIKYSFT